MKGSGQPSGELSPRFRDRHGHWVLSLSVDLDISVRDAIDRELREHTEAIRSSVVIVDLSAVTFMDSAGPGLDPLLRVHGELAELERVLALRSISAAVDRAFRLIARIRPDDLTQQSLGTGSSPLRPVPTVPDLGANDPDWRNNLARHLQAAMEGPSCPLPGHQVLLMGIHECKPEQARLTVQLRVLRPQLRVLRPQLRDQHIPLGERRFQRVQPRQPTSGTARPRHPTSITSNTRRSSQHAGTG